MTYLNEPTATTGESVAHPAGSPRWLQIARDVVVILTGLLVSAAILWAAAAVNRAGNALRDVVDPAPTSTTCTDPNVPWCTPGGG